MPQERCAIEDTIFLGTHGVQEGIVECWTIRDVERVAVPKAEKRGQVVADVCQTKLSSVAWIREVARCISNVVKNAADERDIEQIQKANDLPDDFETLKILEIQELHPW